MREAGGRGEEGDADPTALRAWDSKNAKRAEGCSTNCAAHAMNQKTPFRSKGCGARAIANTLDTPILYSDTWGTNAIHATIHLRLG